MNADSDSLGLVRKLIATQVRDIPDSTAIAPSQKLYELGVDSLATVNLMVALAEATGTDLEEFLDDDIPTSVQDLCNLAAKFTQATHASTIS